MSIQVGSVVTFRGLICDQRGDAIDVSDATTKTLRFTDGSDASTDQTAAFTTDGTDGYIEYTTTTSDLDSGGNWHVQAYIVKPAVTFWTSIHDFKVVANLPAPAA